MAEQLDLDAVNELNKTLKELTSESSDLSKRLRTFREGIGMLQSPFLSSLASLTSTFIEQRDFVKLQNAKIKEHNEKINSDIAAIQKKLKQEAINNSLLQKLESVNADNIKILEAQREASIRQTLGLGILANTVEKQVQAKQQEINQIKNAATEEKAKKKEALDAQSALIRSKIEEIQENRKNKIKVVRPEAKLKALREQEQSLAAEYAELEKSTGMSASVQEKLNQKESELSVLNERAADYLKRAEEGKEKLINTEDEYESKLKELTERGEEYHKKILESQKTHGELTKAYNDLKTKIRSYITSFNPESLLEFAKASRKVADALFGMVATIRDTQNKLGISSKNALNVIVGNYATSIKSFFTGTTVTAKEVLSAQEAFRTEFGGVLTGDAAGLFAQQAVDMGVTVEQLAQARRVFMTTSMGNVGEAKAQTDRFVAEFQKRGLTSKDAMEAITKNSELFARNGNRFAASFVRAAAEAKKIGVDLGKIDQVGDNIIGDFEGFLMKMSELGAMGFGLDSGRLAEVAETGDTGALFDELRSQLAATGKDITNLRRSEQLALSQAFGIPMAELQRMAGPTAGSGEQLTEQEQTNSLLTNLLDKTGSVVNVLSRIFGAIGGVQSFLLLRIANNTAVSAAKTGTEAATKGIAGAVGGATPTAGGAAGGGVSGISQLTSGLNPASLLKGAAALVIMAGALYVMGKAMQQFKDVSAGDLGVAVGAITALTLALVALGALMASGIGGAVVLAGIGALVLMAGAVYLIGKSLQAVGDSSEGIAKLGGSFDVLASALGRLNALDFSKLDKIKELANTNLALQPITAPTVPTVPPATPKAPPATGAAPTPPPVTPATPVTPVDFAPLEKKLDAVVAAIGRMSVQLDGNKVGRVVANAAASTAQVGVLARSS